MIAWDRIRAGLAGLTLGALSDEELTAAYNAIASKPYAQRTAEDFAISNEYFMRFSGAAQQIAASSGYQVVGPVAVPTTPTTQAASGLTSQQAANLLIPNSNATGNAVTPASSTAAPASSPSSSGSNAASNSLSFPVPAAPRPPAAAPAAAPKGLEALIKDMPPLAWAAIGLGLLLFTQGTRR